jgi:hypothetical protein
MFLITQQLDYNNGTAVLSTWSVPRGYKPDEVQSFVRKYKRLKLVAAVKHTTVQVSRLPL